MTNKRNIELLLLLCSTLLASCFAGNKLEQKIDSKPIAAKYTGGHHDYVCLALYTDSTFFYVHAPHLMPAFQRRMKGRYSLDSASVTLYGKRRLFPFWIKPRPETFRIRGDQVLMFSEERENSESGDFLKAYYTLTLEK